MTVTTGGIPAALLRRSKMPKHTPAERRKKHKEPERKGSPFGFQPFVKKPPKRKARKR